jgi:hypothetical protein
MSQAEEKSLDEVARLLALMLKRDRALQETIVELAEAGIKRGRIAELLGTTPGYAGVAIDRAKKSKPQRGQS